LIKVFKIYLLKAKVLTLSGDKEFKIIGIASHLSDYKLSWLLNEELNFSFRQTEDINIEAAKDPESHKFSTYKYEVGSSELYSLISNRSGMMILVKSLKNIDYILKIEGKVSTSLLNDLIEKIKKIKNILTAFEIDQQSLKPKELEMIA
jgi:hypothetical protein